MKLRILEILKERDMTVFRLCQITSTDFGVIDAYCKNKRQRFDRDVLMRIKNALGLASVCDLFFLED